jgi:hypothetical protein
MTALLRHAFDEAAKLSEAEQDVLASRLLAELAAEDEFDRKIAHTSHMLVRMARAAIAEYHSGRTEKP